MISRKNGFVILFCLCMLAAIPLSPVWYLSPVLVIMYLFLWQYRPGLDLILLCIGEISCFTTWYASPWIAFLVQCSVTGTFFSGLMNPDSETEKKYLFFFFGAFLILTILSDRINHTYLPVILILILTGFFILSVLVSEFRIRKQYEGDRS